MNSLILLLGRECIWSPESWAFEQGGESGIGGQVMIEGQSGWLSVLRDDQLLDDYDSEERATLSAILDGSISYFVEWNGSEIIEKFLRAVPADHCVFVDNDHGLVVPIRAVRDLPLETWITASSLPSAPPNLSIGDGQL